MTDLHTTAFRRPLSVVRLLSSALLLVAAVFPAQQAQAQDPVDVLYTWDGVDTEGWTHASAETFLSNPGGLLEITFPIQSLPESVSDTTWHVLNAGILVTNVSFRFWSETDVPSAVQLYFHSSRSGRMWSVALPKSAAGQWRSYSVALTFTAGWTYGRGSTPQEFAEDLQFVDWVGVYIRRPVNPVAQKFGIDDFRITGYTIPEWRDTDNDGMPDSWESQYGLNPNDPSDAALDLDGDGIGNYGEYRAGTDPSDPNSIFTLEIKMEKSAVSSGFVLEWDSVEGRTYSVWRSSNLNQQFLRMSSGIPGAPPRNQYVDGAATNSGPYYYKIGVE